MSEMRVNPREVARRGQGRRSFVGGALLLTAAWGGLALLVGCEDPGKKSAELARDHVTFLARAAEADVQEVRSGLPQGAELLQELFKEAEPELPGPEVSSRALGRARDKVQDLRVAKSTFFAIAAPDGRILRNDREQDSMVGKDLFQSFPGLQVATKSGYVEARGSMPEASGVRGRDDAQWVAAAAVREGETLRGLYVTGWSWSAYAYRLETGIRSHVITSTPEGGKVPLLYVYVVVDKQVFGAPVAPVVNGEAILKLDPLAHAQEGGEPWSAPLEIEGRKFGMAAQRVPALGQDVAIAVLRSET